jgi:hypothetical protein
VPQTPLGAFAAAAAPPSPWVQRMVNGSPAPTTPPVRLTRPSQTTACLIAETTVETQHITPGVGAACFPVRKVKRTVKPSHAAVINPT